MRGQAPGGTDVLASALGLIDLWGWLTIFFWLTVFRVLVYEAAVSHVIRWVGLYESRRFGGMWPGVLGQDLNLLAYNLKGFSNKVQSSSIPVILTPFSTPDSPSLEPSIRIEIPEPQFVQWVADGSVCLPSLTLLTWIAGEWRHQNADSVHGSEIWCNNLGGLHMPWWISIPHVVERSCKEGFIYNPSTLKNELGREEVAVVAKTQISLIFPADYSSLFKSIF